MGNRLTSVLNGHVTSYSYDADDRLLKAGDTTYSYDLNGNLVSKKTKNKVTTYQYDVASRLAEVSGDGHMTGFVYDGDGNRVQVTVDGKVTNYIWDVGSALPVVLEAVGSEGTTDYVYGYNLICETSAHFIRYYHYDGLGSVVALTNGAGAVTAGYSYDAWGKPSGAPWLLVGQNSFLFTGQQYDWSTGLLYLRARYYDPSTGRFISRDPIVGNGYFSQTLNRYTYVAGNPVNCVDPSGKVLWWIPGAVGAVVNAGGYIAGSLLTHQDISLTTVAAKAAGGFVGGEAYLGILLTTANPFVAGAGAGAISYSTEVAVETAVYHLSGGQAGNVNAFSWSDLGISTVAGGIAGWLYAPTHLANPGTNPTTALTMLTGAETQKALINAIWKGELTFTVSTAIGLMFDSLVNPPAVGAGATSPK